MTCRGGCEICGSGSCLAAGGGAVCSILPVALAAGSAGAIGIRPDAARCDHEHPVPVGAPSTATGISNLAGASTDLCRRDHVHRIELEVYAGAVLIGQRPRIDLINTASVTWTVTDAPGTDRVQIQATAAGGAAYNQHVQACVPNGSPVSYNLFTWQPVNGMSITIPGSQSDEWFQVCFNADVELNNLERFAIRLLKNGVLIPCTYRELHNEQSNDYHRWPVCILVHEQCDPGDVITVETAKIAGNSTITFDSRVLNAHNLDH
jgi:hypothetical protein